MCDIHLEKIWLIWQDPDDGLLVICVAQLSVTMLEKLRKEVLQYRSKLSKPELGARLSIVREDGLFQDETGCWKRVNRALFRQVRKAEVMGAYEVKSLFEDRPSSWGFGFDIRILPILRDIITRSHRMLREALKFPFCMDVPTVCPIIVD